MYKHISILYRSEHSLTLWIQSHYSRHIMPLQRTCTWTYFHLIIRRGFRKKYRQPVVAHSEAKVTLRHPTLTPIVTFISTMPLPTELCHRDFRTVVGNCFRMLALHTLSGLNRRMQIGVHVYTNTETMQRTNTYQFVHPRIIRSFSLLSLSSPCQALVPVKIPGHGQRQFFRQNPNQSSNMPLHLG